MRLFEITFYSVDEDGIYPETSWIVEARNDEEVLARCAELSKTIKGGVFMSRAIASMKLDNFSDEFIISELENL